MTAQEPAGVRVPRPRWLLTGISLRHRLTVTLPMNFLGVFENLTGLLTGGFVHPGWSTALGLRNARNNARRAAARREAEHVGT